MTINKTLIISVSFNSLSSQLSTNPFNEISLIINITANSNNIIEYICVRSHTGIIYNEEFDILKNNAISFPESIVINSLPFKDIFKIIDLISTQQW